MVKFNLKNKLWEEYSSKLDKKCPNYGQNWISLRFDFMKKYGPIGLENSERDQIKKFKNLYDGKRIFVIGNGPSLNRTPLNFLKNEYTFGVNGIYHLYDKLDFKPTFYTITDRRVISDIYQNVNALTNSLFFFDEKFRGLLREGSDVFYFETRLKGTSFEDQHFSFDISKNIRHSNTVVGWAIQIASYMGFREIYLIGCDLGYKVQESVLEEGSIAFNSNKKMLLTGTKDDDPNHFDPSYFGKNRKYHYPNEEGMITNHKQYKEALKNKKQKIFNATIGGELEVYNRIDFYSLFPDEKLFYNREDFISLDESEIISQLCDNNTNNLAIDIGGFSGSTSLKFLKKNWNVICFEPDSNNRKKLINNVKSYPNIQIDSRAISNKKEEKVKFYTSEVSRGISSLNKFHNKHELSQFVDTITMKEVIDEYRIKHINFLKIDAEGEDLNILKSFPWDLMKPDIILCEYDEKKKLIPHLLPYVKFYPKTIILFI